MKQIVITALVLLQAYVLHQSTCVMSLTTQESPSPQPSAFTPALSPGEETSRAQVNSLSHISFSRFYGLNLEIHDEFDKAEKVTLNVSIWVLKGTVSLIDYNILEEGTSGFKESNILGQGGFGCVYSATLENNISAAVKKLDCANEDAAKEFKSEVEILSKLQHPNIISLLGYSTNDTARFIVYELMPNVSLESHLHGSSQGSAITWPMRMKIALDVTRGLEYLHEHCHPAIIHRDLKSSNILLDSNFNAKISDFGLAVVDGPKNKNHKLSGTVGYVAPEYLLNGQLTEKSDVYAFGVVLLELLLGKKPVEKLAPGECQSIITWAMPYLTDRTKLPSVIDPAIKDTMDLKHLYQVAAVAILCVQPEPSYRPLITDVLHSLIPLVPMELGGTLKTIKCASMDHC
uniref:Ser/thr specific protein kinase-like protein n=2 Tax=Arabidopsis thaliana TaxID=3702 RepID=Q9FY63_ARATH|nr:ser/thr specific protein kinase-like protein [Arabidopsis thaliana]